MSAIQTDNMADVLRPHSAEVVQALVDNHREFLAFLLRRVESRAVAEDILQDAFTKGLDRLDSIRSEDSAVAWFYRALRNAVTDHYRRQGAKDRALANVARELEEAVEPDAETRDAVCRCVSRLAETLKPEYALALKRIEVDGLSMQAYAEEAGITANNAAVRVHRARQALRKRVSESCGTCAAHGCLDCTCDSSQGHGCGDPAET
jgi:RNA polymerase sigma-70 factor (ECF subfamily)